MSLCARALFVPCVISARTPAECVQMNLLLTDHRFVSVIDLNTNSQWVKACLCTCVPPAPSPPRPPSPSLSLSLSLSRDLFVSRKRRNGVVSGRPDHRQHGRKPSRSERAGEEPRSDVLCGKPRAGVYRGDYMGALRADGTSRCVGVHRTRARALKSERSLPPPAAALMMTSVKWHARWRHDRRHSVRTDVTYGHVCVCPCTRV